MEELEKLSEDELFGLAYDAEIVNKKMMNTKYEYGKEEGRAEGLEEGKAEGKKEIINQMLKNGMSVDEISKVVSLDKEYIEKIQRDV